MSAREGDSITVHCSFCGKSQHDVLAIIAGPNVYVCDECVVLCDGIVAEHRIKKAVDDALTAHIAAHPAPAKRSLWSRIKGDAA